MYRVILCAALLGATGLLATGCRHGGFGHHAAWGGRDHKTALANLARRLDLNETQRDKIGDILRARQVMENPGDEAAALRGRSHGS